MKKDESAKIEHDKSLSSGITSDELYNKLKTHDSLFLLDLRNKNEYNTKHIQGSVLVSTYVRTKYGILPKIENTKKEIILICDDGIQSNQYAKTLNKIGIKSHYLIGDIENWNYSLYRPSYLIDEKFS